MLKNFFCILRRYWRDLLSRRQTVSLAFYRTPFIFHQLRELIREMLAHRVHEFAFSLQTQSLYDASIPGLPHFVYTDHTHLANLSYPGFNRDELFAREWIDLEQQIYRNAAHIFVMSHHVRDSLVDQYACDPARTTCVFAGSNVDPAPVALQNDGYQNRRILFVGTEWERKGGPTLFAAFEKVLLSEPSARLVIIGCNPPVSHPQVEILGRVPREVVKEQLVRASVFCLPTRVEPFGIAVVEAFYHKLPVVASRIGAMPDLVIDGETGRLVPSDDSDALAAALLSLLRDPETCRRFGERGFEFVRQNYSWDTVGEKLRRGIMATLAAQPVH